MEEIWKKSEFGCGNYEFSSLERVRNIKLNKIIKGVPNSRGYLRICNTRTKTRVFIHKEVARLFLGECPNGYIVNHIDNNPLNNAVSNLEYITQSDNILHAIVKFDKKIKFKNEQLFNLIRDYKLGMSISDIAKKYNTDTSVIYNTLHRYGTRIKISNNRDNQQPSHKYNYERFND